MIKYEKEYKLMLDTWGEEPQIDMCIEEMAELTQALCKYKRNKRAKRTDNENLENVQEEIADVLHCVNQMSFLFGEDAVNTVMEKKLERTLKKLEGKKTPTC